MKMRYFGLAVAVSLTLAHSALAGCGGKRAARRAARQCGAATYVQAAPVQACGGCATSQAYPTIQSYPTPQAAAPVGYPPVPGKSPMPYPFPQ